MQSDAQRAQLAIRPTRFTLYLRRSLPWQLWRFIVINVRMTVMIFKSHHTRLRLHEPPASSPLRGTPAEVAARTLKRPTP